jgi:hypothetical protein
MRTLYSLFLIVALLFPAGKPSAADVFDRLSAEPVTVLDFGIKRLRSMAQLATKRIVLSSEPTAQTNVDFDKEKRELRIVFGVRVNADAHNMGTCAERRRLAIREVFLIDTTNYSVPVSTEQRVIFRLGRMFTKEPADQRDSIQAMGERMSESTFLQINVFDSAGNNPITCGGRVTNLKGN